MNNDYCLQSGLWSDTQSNLQGYRNNYQGVSTGVSAGDGAGAGATANKLYWYQKTQLYKVITNPMFIVYLIIFIVIIVVIYWNYIRPMSFKKIIKNYYNLKGSNTLI